MDPKMWDPSKIADNLYSSALSKRVAWTIIPTARGVRKGAISAMRAKVKSRRNNPRSMRIKMRPFMIQGLSGCVDLYFVGAVKRITIAPYDRDATLLSMELSVTVLDATPKVIPVRN